MEKMSEMSECTGERRAEKVRPDRQTDNQRGEKEEETVMERADGRTKQVCELGDPEQMH